MSRKLSALDSLLINGELDDLDQDESIQPEKPPTRRSRTSRSDETDNDHNAPISTSRERNQESIDNSGSKEAVISNTQNTRHVEELPTKQIRAWMYADRPENELYNLQNLAEDIKENGQSSPILVRRLASPTDGYKYEFIFGCRRLNACRLLNFPVKALVFDYKELSDQKAFALMFGENENRHSISSWARGISFNKVLTSGLYRSKRELSLAIGKNADYIQQLTAYANIPVELVEAIGSMEKISINTANELIRLAKNPKTLSALIDNAEKLRLGISPKKLTELIQRNTKNLQPKLKQRDFIEMISLVESDTGNVQLVIDKKARPNLSGEELKLLLAKALTRSQTT